MKRILNLFLVLLMGLVLVGLGTKEVRAEEIPFYLTGWEDLPDNGTNNNYTTDKTFLTNELSWSTTFGDVVSSGTPLTGARNAMFRVAKDATTKPTLALTEDNENNVSKVIFYGKADRLAKFNVYYKELAVDGWVFYETQDFATKAEIHTIDFSLLNKEITNFKIEMYFESSGARADFRIDDVELYAKQEAKGITATINQLIGEGNETPIAIDAAEYGQDIVIPIEPEVEGNEFQFGVVNGVVRHDLTTTNNTLPITDGLDVSLVYGNESNHAVLFIDSNGKLLLNTWVETDGSVEAPTTTNLSKPGYKISEIPWLSNEGDTSLNNITSSRVYTLQYELVETPIEIIVNGIPSTYEYNEVVTITSTNPDFKAWVDEDDNVLSTKPVYSFTALTDKTIVESTDEPTTLPVVTMTNDLTLRSEYQTFVGQLELRDGDTLVEYGLVASEDVLLSKEELTLDNAEKLRSYILAPVTNEFMLSIPTDYVVVRAYVTVRNSDNEIKTLYSDNQYNDVAFVMLDKEALAIDEVATIDGLELPLTGLNGTTITWISNNESVITNDGIVTLPEEATTVTMTATIKSGNVEDTKEFEVTVLPEGQEPEPETYTATIEYTGSQLGTDIESGDITSYLTINDPGEGNITVHYAKGTGNNNIFNNSAGEIRLYVNGEVKIKVGEGLKILSVEFSTSRNNGVLVNGSKITDANVSVTFDTPTNELSIKADGNQVRMGEFTITYRAK